jgi:hypothetical protein
LFPALEPEFAEGLGGRARRAHAAGRALQEGHGHLRSDGHLAGVLLHGQRILPALVAVLLDDGVQLQSDCLQRLLRIRLIQVLDRRNGDECGRHGEIDRAAGRHAHAGHR